MEEQIIHELKFYINNKDIIGLKTQWKEFVEETDFGRDIAWDFVFQKIYIHACLKKQREIVSWLLELFEEFNEFHKIALRPTFAYGRYLLNK